MKLFLKFRANNFCTLGSPRMKEGYIWTQPLTAEHMGAQPHATLIHFTLMPRQPSLPTSIYLATLSQTWVLSQLNYNLHQAHPAGKHKKLRRNKPTEWTMITQILTLFVLYQHHTLYICIPCYLLSRKFFRYYYYYYIYIYIYLTIILRGRAGYRMIDNQRGA